MQAREAPPAKGREALGTRLCLRLRQWPSIEDPRFRLGSGEAQNYMGPYYDQCGPGIDCLRRKQESGYHLKAVAPAASTNGFPKASRPLAAGGWLPENLCDAGAVPR